MIIPRTDLIRFARETAAKAALSDHGILAACLVGSLCSENPYLGNSTDIDILYIHDYWVDADREIIPLAPGIHLDILHTQRSLYEKPKDLRIHPFLGPLLYNPLTLYISGHFFEFVQAGVRDRYFEPSNVLLRSHALTDEAITTWRRLQSGYVEDPAQVLDYLHVIFLAGNAVAMLVGETLSERRLFLQFPACAQAAGKPELGEMILSLLGASHLNRSALEQLMLEWEKAFTAAADVPSVNNRISIIRLDYYRMAFTAMLKSETPHAILWPLLYTWSLSVQALPPEWIEPWSMACHAMGLSENTFPRQLENLNRFLEAI
jgi:hypothetical protein